MVPTIQSSIHPWRDSNTRYFHSIANGRHIKKRIHSLIQEEGTIEGHDQLKSYITNYYKSLFGAPEEGNFTLDESRTDDIPQVSDEENSLLTDLYSEDEVRKAVFQMKHNTARGPDGFPAEFFQNYLLNEVVCPPKQGLFCRKYKQ